jgi:hypothetical protein
VAPTGMFEAVLKGVLADLVPTGMDRSFVHATWCMKTQAVTQARVYPQTALATFPVALLRKDTRFHTYVRDYDVNTMVPVFAQWGTDATSFQASMLMLPAADKIAEFRRDHLVSRGHSVEGLMTPDAVRARVQEMTRPDALETYRVLTPAAAVAAQPPTENPCSRCAKPAATKVCTGCKANGSDARVRYCTAECQRAHWSTHAPFCTKELQLATSEPCRACANATLLACKTCRAPYCSAACYTSERQVHLANCRK